jgi:SpoIIAA-like
MADPLNTWRKITMLQQIPELPDAIDGLRASGRLTAKDIDEVVRPMLGDALRDGRRIRLLWELGLNFQGFTSRAAWEGARVGLQYLRLFERCAVISEVSSTRRGARLMGALLPCPVHVFETRKDGLDWLVARITPHLSHRLFPESGVVVVEPTGALRAEDFDAIGRVVDPWIEVHGALRGVVVHMRALPGWDGLGAVVRHLQFVREHLRSVHRVAFATDSRVGQLTPKLVEPFVTAELKPFGYGELNQAIAWASA